MYQNVGFVNNATPKQPLPAVIQKIHKTFADPHSTTFDPATLKTIIARLDDIEKKLENIVYMNQQADSLEAAARQQQSGIVNLPQSTGGVIVGSSGDEGLELKLESLDSDSELIGEFIEQDELKLVEFPINRIEELKELEESITTDQESFVSFVSFVSLILVSLLGHLGSRRLNIFFRDRSTSSAPPCKSTTVIWNSC